MPETLTVDELITLERFEEAGHLLRARAKEEPKDLGSRIKLALVLTELGQRESAVLELLDVSDLYAEDGFYDKSLATLKRAMKLDPTSDQIDARVHRAQQLKALDKKRDGAIAALRVANERSGAHRIGEIELKQLWDRLARTGLARELVEDELAHFLESLELFRLASEQELVVARQRRDELFFVTLGELEAWVDAPERSYVLKSFGLGDVIGEKALFEQRPWPLRYTAKDTVVMLRLTREGLERALLGNPNPRRMLSLLRSQGNDEAIEGALAKIG